MTEKQAIDLLRHALASICVEIETDSYPDERVLSHCHVIADEALCLTDHLDPLKDPRTETCGYLSWRNRPTS